MTGRMIVTEPQFMAAADGTPLAFRHAPGTGPTLVFLPGYASDMEGAKAAHLAGWCAERGRACLRLDYSGHGRSGGRFADGTIGRWRDDALAVIDGVTRGTLVLVGSSMGGWIALLVALARPDRVVRLVGLAAAPDFTEDLMWAAMTQGERAVLTRTGVLATPSEYGPPLQVTRALIEDGRRHLLLRGPIGLECPVRLLHGALDADVPWERSLRLARAIASDDVQLTLVKGGDHRLSRPADLALIERLVEP